MFKKVNFCIRSLFSHFSHFYVIAGVYSEYNKLGNKKHLKKNMK